MKKEKDNEKKNEEKNKKYKNKENKRIWELEKIRIKIKRIR